MQFVLRVVGIAALVIAALFAVLAVHYYLTQHIRAVMDDLSGKARAQGVARTRRNVAAGAGARGGRRAAAAPSVAPVPEVREAPVPVPVAEPLPAAPQLEDEDGSGTMLVAAFTAQNAQAGSVSDEDDLATMVDSPDASYDEDDLATMVDAGEGVAEDDLATMVDAGDTPYDEDDLATMVDAGDAGAVLDGGSRAGFQLTKRIVLIHAQEVIASSEETFA